MTSRTCTTVVLAYDEVALEIDLATVNLQVTLDEGLVALAPIETVGLSDQQIHQSNLVGSNVAMITAQTICVTESGTTISDRVFYTVS